MYVLTHLQKFSLSLSTVIHIDGVIYECLNICGFNKFSEK